MARVYLEEGGLVGPGAFGRIEGLLKGKNSFGPLHPAPACMRAYERARCVG